MKGFQSTWLIQCMEQVTLLGYRPKARVPVRTQGGCWRQVPPVGLGQRPSRGRRILFQIHLFKDFFVPWVAADIIKCWMNFDKAHVRKSFFIRFL